MSQTSLSFKEVEIDKNELKKRLGGQNPDELLDDKEVIVRNMLRPVYTVRDSNIDAREDGVHFEFGFVKSRHLVLNLTGCSKVHVVCISLGAEADRLLRRAALKSAYDQYVTDAVLSAYIESCVDYLQDSLYGSEELRPRFAPGYGDFDIHWQEHILKYLDAGDIGVSLSDSMLLVPTKTITAVIGVKNNYE